MTFTREEYELDRKKRDLVLIKRPLNWPRYPVMPLKRRDPEMFTDPFYCGIVLAWEAEAATELEAPVKVYNTNMYALAVGNPRPKNWGEALAGKEFKTYASLDDLVVDWTVD